MFHAFRTHDITKLLDYQIEAVQLSSGMKVLDAGCGVCGHALYFAQNAGVEVHAITISKGQFVKSKENKS